MERKYSTARGVAMKLAEQIMRELERQPWPDASAIVIVRFNRKMARVNAWRAGGSIEIEATRGKNSIATRSQWGFAALEGAALDVVAWLAIDA